MKTVSLSNADVNYLDEILLDGERVKVLPAAELSELNPDHIRLWCHYRAVYLLPSAELVAWIQERIRGRRAIEIGSGNGCLGRALGIPMYDNFMQRDFKDVVLYYTLSRQPRISYGTDVQKRNANASVRMEKPQVVVGSWITHLYRESEHERGGNQYGVDELKLLEQVETYIHVGCAAVHQHKRWTPTEVLRLSWLFGRGTDRVIQIWERT